MQKKKNKYICLYGNATEDIIYHVNDFLVNSANISFKSIPRLGGVYNLERVFYNLDKKNKSITIVELFYNTSNATVIESNNGKTSVVNWSKDKVNFENIKSSWNHIAYLDRIPNQKDIYKLKHIHSADICGGKYTKKQKKDLLKLFALVDFAILSSDEIISLFGEDSDANRKILASITKKGLILHFPSGCAYYNKYKKPLFFENSIKKIKNVTGAGDTFAAIFIYNYLLNHNINKAIKIANDTTFSFLK